MERVAILINKLSHQLNNGANLQNMLVTAQLLQCELIEEAGKNGNVTTSSVSVVVPKTNGVSKSVLLQEIPTTEPAGQTPEKIIFGHTALQPDPVAEVMMAEVKPARQGISWPVDPIMEIPTLAHQEKVFYELNETIRENDSSINDQLKDRKVEMAEVLNDGPVRDLKKAISINERHQFIYELFRGDETMYERSIKTINGFNIFAEAEYWIQRELKLKGGWDANNKTVKIFDQLVKRRFL